jgi:3-oxoacyl-[acyl-carrier protein] reductase
MKLAIVTGGSKGLGRALVLELGARGHTFVALHRGDVAAAEETLALARARGIAGRTLALDIATVAPDDLRLPELERCASLVLVHNACAPFVPRPLHLVDDGELDALIGSSLRGPFRLTRALLRPLMRVRGTVVSISSTAVSSGVAAVAAVPAAGFSAYAAVKAGLETMTRALVADYGARGLRAFTVAPGYMDSALTAAWPDELRRRAAAAGSVTPETVAAFVADRLADAQAGHGESYALGRAD